MNKISVLLTLLTLSQPALSQEISETKPVPNALQISAGYSTHGTGDLHWGRYLPAQ